MLEAVLFWLGVAFVVVALLMLFLNAFQQNKIWGIAGLILLLPLLVHIFIKWEELTVRKATYAMVIGILTIFVSIAGGALAHLPFLPEHEVVQSLEKNIAPPKDTPLPNEEQAQAIANPEEDYDPLLSGSEFEEVDVEKMVPPSAPAIQTTVAAKYQPLLAEDLPLAINKQVRLTMTEGEVVEGILTHLQDSAATVESAVEGGSLGLSYDLNKVKSIEVRLAAGEQLMPPAEIEQLDLEEKISQSVEPLAEDVVSESEPTTDIEQPVQDVQDAIESITQGEQQDKVQIQQQISNEEMPILEEDATINNIPAEINPEIPSE